jgi:hypothetical protein
MLASSNLRAKLGVTVGGLGNASAASRQPTQPNRLASPLIGSRYAIAFALRRSRKIIRGLKEGLSEEERYAVADRTVAQLKERGDHD